MELLFRGRIEATCPYRTTLMGVAVLVHEKDLGRYFVLRCKRFHRLMTLYDVFISV